MTRLLVAALLTMAIPALAQPQAARKPTKPDSSQRVTELTFGEGDLIDAENEGPDFTLIDSRPEVQHSSLVRVRVDFDAEVMHSAEQLSL